MDVDILNCQNLYNHIMGYVDLDDLLAHFYRYSSFYSNSILYVHVHARLSDTHPNPI